MVRFQEGKLAGNCLITSLQKDSFLCLLVEELRDCTNVRHKNGVFWRDSIFIVIFIMRKMANFAFVTYP